MAVSLVVVVAALVASTLADCLSQPPLPSAIPLNSAVDEFYPSGSHAVARLVCDPGYYQQGDGLFHCLGGDDWQSTGIFACFGVLGGGDSSTILIHDADHLCSGNMTCVSTADTALCQVVPGSWPCNLNMPYKYL